MNPLQEALTGAASVGVCHGSSCSMAFCEDVLEAGEDHAARSVPVRRCGCLGHCDEGPNVVYDGVVYTDMDPRKMRALLVRLGLTVQRTSQRPSLGEAAVPRRTLRRP